MKFPLATSSYGDRSEAGEVLAEAIREQDGSGSGEAIVLGLPRGGVPVAAVVADRLGLPLDVLVVRKLGAPMQPELAVGAIGSGGAQVMNRDVIRRLGLSEEELEAIADSERRELRRREREYRGERSGLDLGGKTAILVDDGLATGASMRAAIEVARELGAERVVVATPVAPPDARRTFESLADAYVCPLEPAWFRGVGQFYDRFDQTTDDEVRRLMGEGSGRGRGGPQEN